MCTQTFHAALIFGTKNNDTDVDLKALEENMMERLARGELPEMMADPNSETIDRDLFTVASRSLENA